MATVGPIVISDGSEGWPATKEWTVASLSERCNGVDFDVGDSKSVLRSYLVLVVLIAIQSQY